MPNKYPGIRFEVLNPKSVTINDLYGYMDINTMEWYDGVLSTMMARLCRDESLDIRWMVLDGPVDTLWIESMNTVLDDNKVANFYILGFDPLERRPYFLTSLNEFAF
jgi:dynein heavy chain